MRCSHCGLCGEETDMLLSQADIERLEGVRYDRKEFTRYDRQGYIRLRNQGGFCFFYDVTKSRCKVYEHRPWGCRIYPVMYSEEEGVVLDDLCPMKDTVSKTEIERKGKQVIELLQRIDRKALSNSHS
ncbi:MAG: YkgJ family cysteine cluster protein [Thermoproteota archaeon]